MHLRRHPRERREVERQRIGGEMRLVQRPFQTRDIAQPRQGTRGLVAFEERREAIAQCCRAASAKNASPTRRCVTG
jgi:hypothetical protein